MIFYKPSIISVIENEGIELKLKGRDFWALCPLHNERTPSFKVDPERQTFYCFGCHEHGDAITFIEKYKELSFKDALTYLGIVPSRRIEPNPWVIRKSELVEASRQWLDYYTDFLCNFLRMLDRAKMKATTMKQVEAMAYHYHHEQLWQYDFEILLSKDEEAKFELYKELKGNGKGI